MIIIRTFDFATPEYDESIRLRNIILRKPLGLYFEIEDLELEYNFIHLGAFLDAGPLIGCLVLQPLEKGVYKMQQVAITENMQRKGVGQLLVKGSEQLLKSLGAKKIELNARDTAIPFYLKLNYKKSGKEFAEVGIPHYKMVKKLA